MNRSIIILIALLFVSIVAVGVVLLSRSNTQAPSGQGDIPTVIYPPDSSGSSNSQSKAAVQSAFRNELAKHPSDNTKLYATVIAGNYALQVWIGDIMGGQALLKYDTGQDRWILVDGGGGAWSVDELVSAGVPRDTATVLLANVPHY